MKPIRLIPIVSSIALILASSALVVSLHNQRQFTAQISALQTSISVANNQAVATTITPSTNTTEAQIIQTIANAQDAVVSVIITKDLPILERYYEKQTSPFSNAFPNFGFNGGIPFEFSIPQYRQNGTEEKEVGGGTAFFISTDGLLLTNKHVVSDTEATYTVLLNDGRKLEAKVVAQDPSNDIALLQVEGANFTAIPLTQAEPQLGQSTIAIGNALGEFRNTVSIGVISGLKRSINAGSFNSGYIEHLDSIIQTDAAINQGNSGGPLLDLQGNVVGMNTAIAAGAQNIGFAIPASDLRTAVESYKKNGKILKAFLGIRYIGITKELQEKNKLDYDYGVLIARGETAADLAVVPGSPADKAGLQENDIILEIDNQKLDGTRTLAGIVQKQAPGTTIRLKIVRKGKEQLVDVTLEEQQ